MTGSQRNEEDTVLVESFLKRREDLTTREAADGVTGVTPDDVSRWRRGDWAWLTGKKRRSLQSWLAHHRNGAVREKGPEYALAPGGMMEFVAEMGALGVPGERTPRKLSAIDNYIGYLTDVERPVPKWLYDVRQRVERGEL